MFHILFAASAETQLFHLTGGRIMTNERKPNQAQMDVINETDHNLILFASAGTGKTFTVAQRVKHIIESGRAKPEEILCLTFTLKAANEMRDDILLYAGETGNGVNTKTIHSFALQVLKEESIFDNEFYSLPGVYDEVDELELLRSTVIGIGLDENAPVLKSRNALTHFVSIMKHKREILDLYGNDEESVFTQVYHHIRTREPATFEKMLQFFDYGKRREIQDFSYASLMDSSAGLFLHQYNQALRQSNLLDFDDLICLTHRLFRNTDAVARWQSRYRFLIVDEMQDTSELEYDVFRQLFPKCNVMMCGDFFQTIYEWRGSNPEKILNEFINEFPIFRTIGSAQKNSITTIFDFYI